MGTQAPRPEPGTGAAFVGDHVERAATDRAGRAQYHDVGETRPRLHAIPGSSPCSERRVPHIGQTVSIQTYRRRGETRPTRPVRFTGPQRTPGIHYITSPLRRQAGEP